MTSIGVHDAAIENADHDLRAQYEWLERVGLPDGSRQPRWARVPQAADLRRTVQRYCDTLAERLRRGQGVLVTGGVGIGKTCCLALIADAAMDVCAVAFARLPELYAKLHKIADGRLQNECGERIRLDGIAEWHAPLLLLDDLGTEYMSPFAASQFHQLLEHRHANGLSVCVTSNLTAQELMADQDMERVIDRLRETCVWVEVPETVESQRAPASIGDWN